MSSDWFLDMQRMHTKYGFQERVRQLSPEELQKLLEFRVNFLQEELNELRSSTCAEDAVDALVDLIVVAIGSLELYQVDAYRAWDSVLRANMSKEVGVKASRPNPLKLPDLVKPAGWVAPSHEGNVGMLRDVFELSLSEVR